MSWLFQAEGKEWDSSLFLVIIICSWRHTQSYVNILKYITFTCEVFRHVMATISRGYIKRSLAQQCFWGTKHSSHSTRMESLKRFG
jgi:hypothetical protein